MPTPNTFKVPAKKWKSWSLEAHRVFNELYALMRMNQTIFSHPKAPHLHHTHWTTIAWNAAWVAADAVDDQVPEPGDKVEDIDLKTGKPVKTRRIR